jgi:IS5 family transposase
MGVDGHVSLGRGESDPEVPDQAKPATKRMHRKRRTKRSRKIYKQRKAIVEPVFGWIKSVLGFRSFSMRGLEKVSGEWSLVCLALNLKRMGTKLEWAP